MSSFFETETAYHSWLEQLSVQYQRSQIKAAVSVNREMLSFYWLLGRDITAMRTDSKRGSRFYETLCRDLRVKIPAAKCFSVTNLKYMTYFYALFPSAPDNRPQVGDDSNSLAMMGNLSQPGAEREASASGRNLPQPGADSERAGVSTIHPQLGDEIFCLPWGHIKLIIDKCRENPEKAAFYVRESVKNNWSRAVLHNWLDTDLYARQGKAITNFALSLPAPQSDLAQEITRDPYNFDFIELTVSHNEKQLKDALLQNVQQFLMELGSGFAFMGKEYRLVVGKTEQYLDMLFYHTQLHCYIVVEVKVTDFDPRDMGQLATYVSAVDGLLKGENDAPTLGLLICKTKDNVLAQYAVDVVKAPIGISEYELSRLIPKNLSGLLPSIEEIEEGLK